jgi:hypothetical protein
LYAGLDFVEGTDRTIETLVVFVNDGFKGVLEVSMGLLKLAVFVGSPNRTSIQQLERYMYRNAFTLAHGRPFCLDVLEDHSNLLLCAALWR